MRRSYYQSHKATMSDFLIVPISLYYNAIYIYIGYTACKYIEMKSKYFGTVNTESVVTLLPA